MSDFQNLSYIYKIVSLYMTSKIISMNHMLVALKFLQQEWKHISDIS